MKEDTREHGGGKGEVKQGKRCDEQRFRDEHRIFVIGHLSIWKNQIPSLEGQRILPLSDTHYGVGFFTFAPASFASTTFL